MNTFCTAKTAFIEFWAWPNKAFWSSLTSCGENRNMWPFKRDVEQYFVLINFERFCCRTETTYKLVFFSDLPLLPLDDPLTATVVDSHYHSWSRVHQETSLPLLTSIQIVCPWQLLTVITKPVQHKNEVVINSLYKALPLSLIYWFWDALNHTKEGKCNNDGLTWHTTSKQVTGTYYEGRTANVHERWKTIKATNEFWIFKLGSDSNEILSTVVTKMYSVSV